MSTKWVVTAAAERITLDDQRTGETTFTVTNPGGAADQVVFDVVAGDGADDQWFSVTEPQRLVRGGASVSYRMKVAVPGETAPGAYAVQGRVYSVDSAPEETSVLSPRVLLEVAAEPEPVQRRWPWWWWLVAAGLVLVILVVVGVLAFGGGGDGEDAAPAPSPAFGELVMPDLLGMSERDALRTLAGLELTVRPIQYRHDPENADQVIEQSLEPDSVVDSDAVVDLEVAVELTALEVTGPDSGVVTPPGEAPPTLEWAHGPSYVRSWSVTVEVETCEFFYDTAYHLKCGFSQALTESVGTPSLSPELAFVDFSNTRLHTGWVRWRVAALDDFEIAGPPSADAVFLMRQR